jgi:predicted transcriptional regulator
VSGKEIRLERTIVGVTGAILSRKAGICRSRLSDIERGYSIPDLSEQKRLKEALDALRNAKAKVSALAVEVGWPF